MKRVVITIKINLRDNAELAIDIHIILKEAAITPFRIHQTVTIKLFRIMKIRCLISPKTMTKPTEIMPASIRVGCFVSITIRVDVIFK